MTAVPIFYLDCRLPTYYHKDEYATLVVSVVRLKDNKFVLPYSQLYKKTHRSVEINIPPVLSGKKIKEIRIIPRSKARFFEIQYTYETQCIQRNLNTNNALAVDLGVIHI